MVLGLELLRGHGFPKAIKRSNVVEHGDGETDTFHVPETWQKRLTDCDCLETRDHDSWPTPTLHSHPSRHDGLYSDDMRL